MQTLQDLKQENHRHFCWLCCLREISLSEREQKRKCFKKVNHLVLHVQYGMVIGFPNPCENNYVLLMKIESSMHKINKSIFAIVTFFRVDLQSMLTLTYFQSFENFHSKYFVCNTGLLILCKSFYHHKRKLFKKNMKQPVFCL